MEFIREVKDGVVSYLQIDFRVGDMVKYHSKGWDVRDLVVDPTVYVEAPDGSLVKTTVKTTRQKPMAGDILTLKGHYGMLDDYVAPASTLAKKKEAIVTFISREVKSYRFGNPEYYRKEFAYDERLRGVAIDYASIEEYAEFILKYYEPSDGIKYRRVNDGGGYFHYVHLDENYESAKKSAIDFVGYIVNAPVDENGVLTEDYTTPYRKFELKRWNGGPFLELIKRYFYWWTLFEFEEIYKRYLESKEE